MFPGVLVDITRGCNAKCPLCVTGREDFGKRLEFMPVAEFERTLDRLLHLDLARPGQTVVSLHNWGEPIVHPDLNGIVAALNARGLRVGISTNASKATAFTVSTAGFAVFTFSVPGWSQASYDKMHGLQFDRVVTNMEATMRNMRQTGYTGRFMLSFHVYQFNVLSEMEPARAWCQRHDVDFFPYYAYINDYAPGKAFLKGTLAPKAREEMSRSLFLHYVDDLVAAQPREWECPQWTGQLTLNHKSEVLVCCVLPYSNSAAVIGSVFELTRKEILAGKKTSKECDDCLGCGYAYWAHNPLCIQPRTDNAEVGYADVGYGVPGQISLLRSQGSFENSTGLRLRLVAVWPRGGALRVWGDAGPNRDVAFSIGVPFRAGEFSYTATEVDPSTGSATFRVNHPSRGSPLLTLFHR